METLFTAGAQGQLFLIHHSPATTQRRSCVVVVPAFAEEMNKSRRQVALQARALCGAGVAVIIPDLSATGESDGDFGQSNLQHWLDDLQRVVSFAHARGYSRLSLLAVRGGALLLAPLLEQLAATIDRLVLWQPQTSGKLLINQFLRLKVAAGMMGPSTGVTTKDLRAQLESGDNVESAGYSLSPALVAAYDALELRDLTRVPLKDIDWIDLGAPDKAVSPANRRVIDALGEAGCNVAHQHCRGEPFWSTAEIATAPEMIELTTTALTAAA